MSRGLRVIYPKSEQKASESLNVDVVAIHGLYGDSEETWTHPKSKHMWLRDGLPQDVPDARIMTFEYNANTTFCVPPEETIDHAEHILNSLKDHRQAENEVNRPIIFVAHCLGGVLVNQTLTWASVQPKYKVIYDNIVAAILLGTPHRTARLHSSDLTIAKLSPMLTASKVLRFLEAYKPARLGEDFKRKVTQEMEIHNFHETKTTFPFKRPIAGDASALNYFHFSNEVKIPVDADHVDICKFASRDDGLYESVYMTIERIARAANKKRTAKGQA